MIITTKHIAIAELVVHSPAALVSIFVVLRHGFHRQLGWIYLFVLCGIRIGGAIMEIRSHNDPSNTNEEEWVIILQSVGLSLLLLSSLGLLKRVAGIYSKRATSNSRRSRAVQILHLPALIALVLSIMGGTDQFSSDVSQHGSGKTKTRVGVILFLAVYICLFVLCMITISDARLMQRSQKRILICVLTSLPLIAVRLLYSLIGDFSNNPDNQFSIVNGLPVIQLAMVTIEEFLIVLMYAILGVFTPRASSPSFEVPYEPQPQQLLPQVQNYGQEPVNYAKYAAQSAFNGNAYNGRQ
ncbi:conserved hypothetical protein [Talaromyces stipitatus ATCC 10500]|uniref:DUF7702 domain-containing protein n=1 Tax=Talaromyces stipitatus (strain ATCC 10500 / CBS 375.48 / QM 6759 / NRRL 1006) TaxID=441959 RepID=B8MCV0_TALSN|nr:uncharacterized protein TSTA_113020 [Talaromyces stipitatus ATCC 10500]EED17476.1 conserved hypothetical protein [Talaromyces stipitatus ATCC 10500]